MILYNLIRKKPILLQIDNYYAWKSLRYPMVAESQKRELKEFSRISKIWAAADIQLELVEMWIDKYSTTYFRLSSYQAIKQFLIYCKARGYPCNLLPNTKPGIMSVMNRRSTLHVSQVKRVRYLKDMERLSYRQIKIRMESEDHRKYDVKNLHGWYHHPFQTEELGT